MAAQVLIYDSRPWPIKWWNARLPDEASRTITTDWPEWIHAFCDARCLILCVKDFRAWDRLHDLQFIRRSPDRHPLIIMTDPERANLIMLSKIVAEGIFWPGSDPVEIRQSVRSALIRGETVKIVEALPEKAPIPLRLAVQQAVNTFPRFKSVQEWTSAVGIDRRTLWSYWQQAFGGAPPIKLKEFLWWLLCMEAVSLKRPGRSWRAVARALRVHPDTLGRISQRILNVGLSDLPALGSVELQERLIRCLATERRSNGFGPPRHFFGDTS